MRIGLMYLSQIGMAFLMEATPAQAQVQIKLVSKNISGLTGSYTSVVRRGREFQFFDNSLGEVSKSGLVMFRGSSMTKLGKPILVVPNTMINDVRLINGQLDPKRMITRPVVRFSEKEQRYYAIVHVAGGYPPNDGRVYPAFLVSMSADPTKGWIYKGRFKGEVAAIYDAGRPSWTSGMGFIVNEEASGAVDHQKPMANKFVLYNEFGGRLKLTYSNDGELWYLYRDVNGAEIDLQPPGTSDGYIFASAVKTPVGYFMYSSYKWLTSSGPAGHHFLYSKDGLKWKIIQYTKAGMKNYSLFYDGVTRQLYVLPTTKLSPPYAKALYVMTPKEF